MGPLSAMVSLAVISGVAYAGSIAQFWNLTAHPITEFYLAPAGTDQWSKNQTVNDPDGSVDHDERLSLVDTPPGTYDLKLKDKSGRECLVKNVVVWTDSVFSLDENQLADCTE